MTTLLITAAAIAAWTAIAFGAAVAIGRSIRTADQAQQEQAPTLRLVA